MFNVFRMNTTSRSWPQNVVCTVKPTAQYSTTMQGAGVSISTATAAGIRTLLVHRHRHRLANQMLYRQ